MSFIKAFDGIPNEDTYSTTWASSQYLTESNNLPPISLSNNSIRQIVHISVSSPTIRLRFSNRLGESDLEIKGVTIANSVSQGSGEVDTLTLTTVTFEGKEEVAIPAKTEIYSDPFYYPLKVQSEVAVSIYFGQMPEKLTSHAGSRTFSFIEKGNKIKNLLPNIKLLIGMSFQQLKYLLLQQKKSLYASVIQLQTGEVPLMISKIDGLMFFLKDYI
jgi:hypothetical protein